MSAHNAIQSVDAGAFGKSLEHLWLTGTNLTCAGLASSGVFPNGAGCTDETVCRAKWGIGWIGNGDCDDGTIVGDPLYSTAECLWDGGDCK